MKDGFNVTVDEDFIKSEYKYDENIVLDLIRKIDEERYDAYIKKYNVKNYIQTKCTFLLSILVSNLDNIKGANESKIVIIRLINMLLDFLIKNKPSESYFNK